ncbi:acyl carrier protein [Halogeometricum borinquense DSM 11551]|uniref:Acyl carrier protein n=2 Tax=Halogeometricum borinquense TaxID=60847 RepID=E4NQ82_HALBP|nr:phosphopantetheine-binding protein [Halogeometricum borinquense]ADQ66644.1 acyl carrier protein [Halogeometricum borinquense DSM 11551]ELY30751.1 acyl carrier protein [Halogeometricum borinquense DSM 11551]RYJ14491.1 acyl carrier protein [Halogeometricum borinquense]
MADSQDTTDHIEGIVEERLRVDTGDFDAETPFDGETLDADSLDLVEIAEAIEADVGVHIPDEDLEELETVGDLTAYVTERT